MPTKPRLRPTRPARSRSGPRSTPRSPQRPRRRGQARGRLHPSRRTRHPARQLGKRRRKIAVDSANQATRIYTAARKADTDRTSLQADQATEAARQALEVRDHLGLTRKWNAAQEAQRDAETNRLLAEAATPGTDRSLAPSTAARSRCAC